MPTKLARWLKANDKTDEWLAAKVGRERSTITRVKLGQVEPPASVVAAIEKATDGEIKAADLVRRPARGAAA